MLGSPGFFKPRLAPSQFWPSQAPDQVSLYDVLEKLVDFDRINAGDFRLSVGAVNVGSGNFIYFDTTTHKIDARHIIASGSLPPGFPATEVDGEYYWDGGIISNTPLQWALDSRPLKDNYHQPVVANSYAGGCYNCGCGGSGYAGAAAAGVAVGAAAAAATAAANRRVLGTTYGYLPSGCAYAPSGAGQNYSCGAYWLAPAYGANGVYYRIEPAP